MAGPRDLVMTDRAVRTSWIRTVTLDHLRRDANMTPPNTPTPDAAFLAHQAEVYTWAYRIVRNHHDALDVKHEVFLKWWLQRDKGLAPSNLIGWLRRVTVNEAIDARRKHALAASKLRSLADHSTGFHRHEANGHADQSAAQHQTLERVTEALSALTDMQRTVLVAKTCDGCTFAKIAEQMDLAVPTVKTHYLRALRALRSRLASPNESKPNGNEVNENESPPVGRIGVPE